MLNRDLLPLYTVQNKGFLSLMKIVAPLYKVPSEKTITRHLESCYDIVRQKFIKKIELVKNYTVTCD